MPITETTTTHIECDNPNCPGHPYLNPADLTGWLLVSHEVYGEPTSSHVFGSADCLSAASGESAATLGFVAAEPAVEQTSA